MRLTIASISMSAASDISEKERSEPPIRRRRSVLFSVYPHDESHMDLATGEVFENPAYSKGRGHGAKAIAGTLELHEAPDTESPRYGVMQYFAPIRTDDGVVDSGPLIIFLAVLPSKDFSDLLENLRHSVLPTTVVVHLESDIFDKSSPFKFGWEPDGSGRQWDNLAENGKHIKIGSVSFSYELLRAPTEDGERFEEVRPTLADTIKAEARALADQLSSIRSDLKIVAVAVTAAAAVLLFRGHFF